MKIDLPIAVSSTSFSQNEELKKRTLEKFSHVVFNTEGKKFNAEELSKFASKAKALIVGVEKIDENFLKLSPQIKVVSKYGVGIDNINFEDCKKRSVDALFSSGVNKTSVAELALSYMLGLARNVFATNQDLKSSKWNKNGGFQLSQKTVGIIGVGHIGKELIRMLQPFQCKILANDIIDQKNYYKQQNVIECSKDEIYKNADFVTVHVPLLPDTEKMMDKNVFSKMKPSAFFINTARGKIVVQADLKKALQDKKIAGAAIDVYEDEPCIDMELLSLPNLVCTPHIGGNAREAVLAMGTAAIDNLYNFLK